MMTDITKFYSALLMFWRSVWFILFSPIAVIWAWVLMVDSVFEDDPLKLECKISLLFWSWSFGKVPKP